MIWNHSRSSDSEPLDRAIRNIISDRDSEPLPIERSEVRNHSIERSDREPLLVERFVTTPAIERIARSREWLRIARSDSRTTPDRAIREPLPIEIRNHSCDRAISEIATIDPDRGIREPLDRAIRSKLCRSAWFKPCTPAIWKPRIRLYSRGILSIREFHVEVVFGIGILILNYIAISISYIHCVREKKEPLYRYR